MVHRSLPCLGRRALIRLPKILVHIAHSLQSWFNEGEILAIVDIVQSLLAERPDIRQEQIAVITPWREHVWRTRAQLRRAGFGGIDVGNVEVSFLLEGTQADVDVQTYQGGEFRITIVSCVRSRSRFLPDDRKANMGLFNERKRSVAVMCRVCC